MQFAPDLTRPGVQAIGLAAFTSLLALASIAVAPGVQGLLGAALAVLMMAIAIVDARHFIIPNKLTLAAVGLGVINAWAREPWAPTTAVAACVLRGAALALAFWGLRALYRRVRGREGIGLGDVKLAAVAGVWLDWLTLPLVIEVAALAALGFYGVKRFVGGRPLRATGWLPFGLFLAPAIWLGWFFEAFTNVW